MASLQFQRYSPRPVVIAGPCMAESYKLLEAVLIPLQKLSKDLDFQLVFKASFDKANRTSIKSYRGPGLLQVCEWFSQLKLKYPDLVVLTDVHETVQVKSVAKVFDILQIPAFLSRQTDLIVAAVHSGRAVNVKKGQFLAPENAKHLISKIVAAAEEQSVLPNYAITERGVCFGYGNLVVDMRGLKVMADLGSPVIFDVTHSLQLPAAGGADGEISGGLRAFAPVLARSAAASGYLDGFFIEVHPDPQNAKSDAATQLSILQAERLLQQLIPIWRTARELVKDDVIFS